MKIKVFIIALVACFLQATEGASPDESCLQLKDALSGLILKFLNNLRSHMDTGIPSMGIPPLDPLVLNETQNFYVYKPYQVNVKGWVSDSVVRNLKSFNVTSIHTSLMHLQANMTFDIPYFIITGAYSLRGTLLSVMPLRGHGPYIVSPSAVTLSVTTNLKLEHRYLQLTSMDFDFDFHRILVKFQGLYGGGHIGDFMNTLANRFGVAVYHKVEPKVHNQIRLALIDGINEKLKEIPLMDLIGMASHKCQESLKSHLGVDLNSI